MRFVRFVHAWSGLILALFVAAIAFSGGFSALRAEYLRVDVPQAKSPTPPASTFGGAISALEISRPGELQSIRFAPYRLGVHLVQLNGGKRAFVDRHGKVVREWKQGRRLEEVTLSLHHTLLLGDKGRIAASLVGVAAFLMVVSGLILILPLMDGVSLRIWPKSLARRDLVTAHRNLSFAFAFFFLLQIPSGVFVNLEPEIDHLFHPVAVTPPPKAAPAPDPLSVDWQKILATAQAEYGGSRIRRAFAPTAPDAAYQVYLSPRGDLSPKGSVVVYLDWEAHVLGSHDARRGAWERRAHNFLFAVHSGDLGPGWIRIFIGVVGLALGVTALMGAASWVSMLLFGSRRRGEA